MPGDPLPSKHGYKAPWVPMSPNHEFWREVLVGKTITDLRWDEKERICGLVLDDGQVVKILRNENSEAVIGIED